MPVKRERIDRRVTVSAEGRVWVLVLTADGYESRTLVAYSKAEREEKIDQLLAMDIRRVKGGDAE